MIRISQNRFLCEALMSFYYSSLNILNFVQLLLVTLTGVKAAFTYQLLLAEMTDTETWM